LASKDILWKNLCERDFSIHDPLSETWFSTYMKYGCWAFPPLPIKQPSPRVSPTRSRRGILNSGPISPSHGAIPPPSHGKLSLSEPSSVLSSVENNDVHLNLLVVGDPGVGKTSLISRFCLGTHSERRQSTEDCHVKSLHLRGFNVKLTIKDPCSGRQSQFRNPSYKGIHGVIVVYDITDESTFRNVKLWLKEAGKSEEEHDKMIAGTHLDLSEKRSVELTSLADLSKELGIEVIETSAKLDLNVDKLFVRICESILFHQYLTIVPPPSLARIPTTATQSCVCS